MFRPRLEVFLARFCAIICGIAFTWTCAVLGLGELMRRTCISAFTFDCGNGPRTKFAKRRVSAIATAVEAYRIDHNVCPRNEYTLIDGGYVDPRNFDDPWDTGISFECTGQRVHVASAGADQIFGTADDITN